MSFEPTTLVLQRLSRLTLLNPEGTNPGRYEMTYRKYASIRVRLGSRITVKLAKQQESYIYRSMRTRLGKSCCPHSSSEEHVLLDKVAPVEVHLYEASLVLTSQELVEIHVDLAENKRKRLENWSSSLNILKSLVEQA